MKIPTKLIATLSLTIFATIFLNNSSIAYTLKDLETHRDPFVVIAKKWIESHKYSTVNIITLPTTPLDEKVEVAICNINSSHLIVHFAKYATETYGKKRFFKYAIIRDINGFRYQYNTKCNVLSKR